MPDLLFRGGHPSRVPPRPITLAPPLVEVWSDWYPHPVHQLPLVSDGIVVYRRATRIHARRESDGKKLWTVKAVDTDPACFWDGQLVAWLGPGTATWLRKDSGETAGTMAAGTMSGCLVSGGLLIGSMVDNVRAYDLERRVLAWAWTVEPSSFGPNHDANFLFMTPCADAERLYFGLRDGTLCALRQRDGTEAWRKQGFLEYTKHVADAKGVAYCSDGVVYFRTGIHVGAFDARTGRRRWAREFQSVLYDGCLYGDRYYAVDGTGGYWVLDAADGHEVLHVDLKERVPQKLWDRAERFNPLFVSETHAFCGVGTGALIALERDSGRFAWHHHPKPRASFPMTESYFQVVNGRLYTGSLSFLRVYEPPAEGGAGKTRKGRAAPKRARTTRRHRRA